MADSNLIQTTANWVKTKLAGEGSGHDWWHIYRVWQTAKTIGQAEKANLLVVELAALLHDIADYKLHGGDEELGGKVAREWLEAQAADPKVINQVVHIVDHISFKGGAEANKIQSLEGRVVQDADRLDSLGAIGIARCFTYGGHKGREIYNPEIKPKVNMNKEEYKKNSGPSLNHFYEKLLKLKDLMNTTTGQKLAAGRHQYLEAYLEQFYAEWEGTS